MSHSVCPTLACLIFSILFVINPCHNRYFLLSFFGHEYIVITDRHILLPSLKPFSTIGFYCRPLFILICFY